MVGCRHILSLIDLLGFDICRDPTHFKLLNDLGSLDLGVAAPDDNLASASAEPSDVVLLGVELDDVVVSE